MAANETIYHGGWIDWSAGGVVAGPSYGGGGTIAGSALATLESNLGKQLSFVNFNSGNWMSGGVYQTFDGVGGGADRRTKLDILLNAGRLPMSPWFSWDQAHPANNYSLRNDAIARGDHDAYITAFATAAKAWGKPLILRFGHEQNLSFQFPWQHSKTGTLSFDCSSSGALGCVWGAPVGGSWINTTAGYVAAWRQIVNIFKNVVGCTNVQFVWCPNIRGTSDTVTYAQMYPGSAYVDWLGLDGYAYRPNMTFAQVFRGTPNFPGGGGTGLQDSYAQMIALDPSLPLMIAETGINGTGDVNPIAVTGISVSGGVWTVTVASAPPTSTNQPNTGWAATQGVQLLGMVPTAYNGQYPIASNISATSFTITNAATPGAVTTLGTAHMMDRIARASVYTQMAETDLPSMSRIRALCWFWTFYGANQWTPDYNGSAPNNLDMLALKAAFGNAHFLAGNQMGTNLATRSWVPFQDQPMPGGITGAVERNKAIAHSIPGLVGEWILNDSAGPMLDTSGKGRNLTVTGTPTLRAGSSIPAEPGWLAPSFSGTGAGNFFTTADAADFSITTTSKFTIETGFFLPSAPTARSCIVGKGSGPSNFEWEVWVSATQFGCTLHPLAGGTFADFAHTLPATGVPHRVVYVIDTSLNPPMTGYLNGGAGIGTGAAVGSLGDGTAALTFGQLADGTLPLTPAGARILPTRIYNTAWSVETVADTYAAWIASPIISALVGTPS